MLRFSTVLLSGILAASINTAIPGIELPDPFASPGEVLRIYGYDRTAEKLLDDYYPDYVPDGDFREKEEGISVRYGNIGETVRKNSRAASTQNETLTEKFSKNLCIK